MGFDEASWQKFEGKLNDATEERRRDANDKMRRGLFKTPQAVGTYRRKQDTDGPITVIVPNCVEPALRMRRIHPVIGCRATHSLSNDVNGLDVHGERNFSHLLSCSVCRSWGHVEAVLCKETGSRSVAPKLKHLFGVGGVHR